MGVPEMEALWNSLSTREQDSKLGKGEAKFFKKLVKALGYLANNPRHNSLASHEIEDLSRRHAIKIFHENCVGPAGCIDCRDRRRCECGAWCSWVRLDGYDVNRTVRFRIKTFERRLPSHRVHAACEQDGNEKQEGRSFHSAGFALAQGVNVAT